MLVLLGIGVVVLGFVQGAYSTEVLRAAIQASADRTS